MVRAMSTVKMRTHTASRLPQGTRFSVYGYSAIVGEKGNVFVDVPQEFAEHEAKTGRLIRVEEPRSTAQTSPSPPKKSVDKK